MMGNIVTYPNICGIPYEDILIRMEAFHGYRSPGMLLGGFMLDQALLQLGSTPYLNVVSETVVCLPDAVQLLTPCTFGNGFLQVVDWGKFALTAYDRTTLKGARTWLGQGELGRFPLIHNWFERTGRPREKPPFELLSKEILSAVDILTHTRNVMLNRPLKDTGPVPTGLCPTCGESYSLRLGSVCPACSGKAYYAVDSGVADDEKRV
jgi:formylmethanofuran dehydrogenase subunit E